MAKYKKSDTATAKPDDAVDKTDTANRYKKDFKDDLDAHNDVILNVPYDALEAMESAKVFDESSKKTLNSLTDSMTDTIYRERASRVVGQLPEGTTKAIGKKDLGKGLYMDLIRTKWIYPNANSQRNFKTKLYMWKKKTSVYNTVCAYVDKTVSPSGYEGPDFWLVNPRNAIPQRGTASLNDMDYFHIIAFWSPERFQDELDDTDSQYDKDILKELMPSFKSGAKGSDPDRETQGRRQQTKQSVKQVKVVTRYEAGPDGNWCTFLPDYGYRILREIPNPHENGKIPVVALVGEPEFDSWYGTSDYQRSMPMQAANDGVLNGYFQGMNKALNPRTFADTTTLVPQTWSDKPGSLVEFTGPFKVDTEEISTASLSNFQAAQGVIKGAIQSIAGTTDTRSNADDASDPAFGKTPEAINKISEREATRDKQDRDTFEEACKELIDLMYSIIPTLKNKIPVDLFEEEIEDILAEHPDLGQILLGEDGKPLVDADGNQTLAFHQLLKESNEQGIISMRPSASQKQIRLRIDPTKLKGLEYLFELDPNSTMAQTKQAQLASFKDLFAFYGTIQNVVQDYQAQNNVMLDLETVNKTFSDLADIPNLDKLFKKVPQQQNQMAETQAAALKAHGVDPQAAQAARQTAQAGPNAPKQLINYKDAPPEIQRQMEAADGYHPSSQGASETPPGTTPPGQPPLDPTTGQPMEPHKAALAGMASTQGDPYINQTKNKIAALTQRSNGQPSPVPNQ